MQTLLGTIIAVSGVAHYIYKKKKAAENEDVKRMKPLSLFLLIGGIVITLL